MRNISSTKITLFMRGALSLSLVIAVCIYSSPASAADRGHPPFVEEMTSGEMGTAGGGDCPADISPAVCAAVLGQTEGATWPKDPTGFSPNHGCPGCVDPSGDATSTGSGSDTPHRGNGKPTMR
jgi:hypothetical protein